MPYIAAMLENTSHTFLDADSDADDFQNCPHAHLLSNRHENPIIFRCISKFRVNVNTLTKYLKSDFDGLHKSSLREDGLYLWVYGGTEHRSSGTNGRRLQPTPSDRRKVSW